MSGTNGGGWADREGYLVGTDWLAEHLDDLSVRIVDCRMYFDGRRGVDAYSQGHIPGAVFLDWSNELATKDDPIAFRMARGPQVKRVMEAHGVGDDTLLVAYDEEGGHRHEAEEAPREAFRGGGERPAAAHEQRGDAHDLGADVDDLQQVGEIGRGALSPAHARGGGPCCAAARPSPA